MAMYKIVGQEQTFTSANTFSSANSTQISGWNCVRVVNISNSVTAVITVNSTPTSNATILPLQEVLIKKSQNTSITASSANLLGTLVAFESNG